MIQGEQYYIEINLTQDEKPLDINVIEKIIFNFDNLEKEYSTDSDDVKYENGIFKVYLKQEETLKFEEKTSYQVTARYIDNTILKTDKEIIFVGDSIKKEAI